MNLILFVSNLVMLAELVKTTFIGQQNRILQASAALTTLPTSSNTPESSETFTIAPISAVTPYTTSAATSLTCNQEMMLSYGLEGYSNAHVTPHRYCPMITHNCCTSADEATSMNLWNNQAKFIIEKYYETYLYSIKYLLGFSQEVFRLAQDFQKSENETCRSAAMDYIGMNFNYQITQDVYKSFVTSLEKMGDIRRGFYCILCDARTQEKLKDFYSVTNLFYQDRIYFSKDFCSKLVDHTIRASYFTVFYLKRFAENMVKLINCKTGNSTALEYEIPYITKQQVKNCYFFKNKYFFFFCESYCQNFHLTKANSIFDGDILELKKFVDHVMATRQSAFYYPSNNILMNGIGFEEDFLKYNYAEVSNNTIFYRATTQQVMLDEFKTDVVYTGGINPWESCENSLYQLVLASSGITKVMIAIVVILLVS